MKYGVFISYSHEDKMFLAPVVQLIQSLRKDLVFQDYTGIEIGKKWEPQLLAALQEAKIVIIFWCDHSANSKWVKKEYTTAIKEKKEIIPVMLDTSKLPRSLSIYQGIDLSHIVNHNELEENNTIKDADTEFDIPYSKSQIEIDKANRKRRISKDQKTIASKLSEELSKRLPKL